MILGMNILQRGNMLPHLYNIGVMILISGIVAVVEDKGYMPSTTTSLFLENNMISNRRRGIRNVSKPGFRREDLKISLSLRRQRQQRQG